MANELPFRTLKSDELEALKKFLDERYPDYTYLDISSALAVYFSYIYRLVMVESGFSEQAADSAVHILLAHVFQRVIDSYEATVAANLPKTEIN